MKSKIKISLFVLLIIGVIGINILYKNKNSQPKPKNNLAIMIDENGNGSYASASSIPKGSYALNEEKTICENGGKVVSYNNLTGQIGFSFLGSDRCSLYFEKVSSPTISNVSLSGSTLNASFNSKKSLCCYAITTSTSEPSDWKNISGSSYELSTSINKSGTYYLWLKDSYGNVTKYDDTISVDARGYETILINNSNGATTYEEAINYIKEKKAPDFSTVSTTNDGLYAADDDYTATTGMKSYYFRGAVDNNWVKFGKDSSGSDMYWRIIRINGDGSIRMIYTGTTAPTSSTSVTMTGTKTQIDRGTFNTNYNNPAYAGYMYTKNVQHGVENDSEIKTVIDNWYKTTTLETDSKTKRMVADSIFCNDRTATSSSSGTPGEIDGNMSTNSTYYYGSYVRVKTNKSPQLTCPMDSDKFTTSTDNGNGALTYPVGLITADEVAMAGGVYDSNNRSYYLHTGENYWLWSPGDFFSKVAAVFYIFNYGNISTNSSNSTPYGYRPVISLSTSVVLSGSGTYDDVYTVS